MIIQETDLKNEAQMGAKPVDYKKEILEFQKRCNAVRQTNILSMLKKLVGRNAIIPVKEFALVTHMHESTVRGYVYKDKNMTLYAIERIAYGLGYFWEKLVEAYLYEKTRNLSVEKMKQEKMSHSLRDEVDEELRHKMVQYFGMPGQDLMEFFSFKKDLGIDIAPYLEAELLSLVKNKKSKNK